MTRHPTVQVAAMLVAIAVVSGRAHAQVALWGSPTGALAQNRSNASGTPERVAGFLAGFQAGATLGRLWEADLTLLGGKLDARQTVGDDRTLTEMRARLGVVALPWLVVRLGGFTRTYSTPIARERWSALRLGAETRSQFVTGSLRAVLRGTLMPLVVVTDAKSPNFAVAAETGLEWQGSRFAASLIYGRERYEFPPIAGFKRIEDFSAISVRVGFRFGSQD